MPTSKIEIRELTDSKLICIETTNGKLYLVAVHEETDSIHITTDRMKISPISENQARIISE